MALGVDYYMLKPVDYNILTKRIADLFEKEPQNNLLISKTDSEKEIEEKITNIFITVGIPAHIKGYQFLREAIKLAMENPDIIHQLQKGLKLQHQKLKGQSDMQLKLLGTEAKLKT